MNDVARRRYPSKCAPFVVYMVCGLLAATASGCRSQPIAAPAVHLTRAAHVGGMPGPIAYADGRVVIASGPYVAVYPTTLDPPITGQPSAVPMDHGIVDLVQGQAIDLQAAGDIVVARLASGRVAILDITASGPVIRTWLDEPMRFTALLTDALITVGMNDETISAYGTRTARLHATSMSNPCGNNVRFLNAGGGEHAGVLCDDGNLWTIDAATLKPMAVARLSEEVGAAEWIVTGAQRVLVGLRRDDGYWAAAIDTDRGREPGRMRRVRLAAANDPVWVVGAAGDIAYLHTESSGMRMVRFDGDGDVVELGVPRAVRGGIGIVGDRDVLAVHRNGHVRIFNNRDPRRIIRHGDLPQPPAVDRVAIAPDGKQAFTLSAGLPISVGTFGLANPSKPEWMGWSSVELDSDAQLVTAHRLVANARSVGLLAEVVMMGGMMPDVFGVIASFVVGREPTQALAQRWSGSVGNPGGRWLALGNSDNLYYAGLNGDSMSTYMPDVPDAASFTRDRALGSLDGDIVDAVVVDGRTLVLVQDDYARERAWLGFVEPWRDPQTGNNYRFDLREQARFAFRGRPIALAVRDGRAFIGMADGSIVAFGLPDTDDLAEKQRVTRLGRIADVGIAARLAIDGDVLFVLTDKGRLAAVDITAGQRMAHAPVSGWVPSDSATMAVDIAAAGGRLVSAEGQDGMTTYLIARGEP